MNNSTSGLKAAAASPVMITAGLRVASSSTSGQFSAFLVPLDLPGITTTAFEDLGGRCAGRGSYYLDGVRA